MEITYDFPKLNHETIKNLSRPISSNEIERFIMNLPTKKSPRPDRSIAEFFQFSKN
jgi:hypothetical protein